MTAAYQRYFAYGSNMSVSQMARRCPGAIVGAVATLSGWRFKINRRGVATLVRDAKCEVTGLVWHLTEACELALDRYEGVRGGHYRKATLQVAGAPTLVYLAAEERPGPPRPEYLEGLLAAAEALGIAPAYREELAGWSKVVTPWLVAEVLGDYRLAVGGVHGPGHWLRVHANGLALAARTPGADAGVVELFALLHDCQRLNENADRGHGARAAKYVRRLSVDGLLRLDSSRLEVLATACAGHELGRVSDDPTIGVCWDADRLELSRLGRRPIPELLSTEAARDFALQEIAWQRGRYGTVERGHASSWGLDHFTGAREPAEGQAA